MNLDMYLYKNKEEKIYWRKADTIHDWFDRHLNNGEGVENVKYYEVTKKIAQDLLRDINTVLLNGV